jgi:hypothetical protein
MKATKDPKKYKAGKCSTPYCRNKRDKTDYLCSKHRKRHYKENDPIAYCYSVTKSNARRRGKEFTLTLEYFRDFCLSTGYIERKGKLPDSLTIDRIKSELGYIPGNIQARSHLYNSTKQDKQENDLPF